MNQIRLSGKVPLTASYGLFRTYRYDGDVAKDYWELMVSPNRQGIFATLLAGRPVKDGETRRNLDTSIGKRLGLTRYEIRAFNYGLKGTAREAIVSPHIKTDPQCLDYFNFGAEQRRLILPER